MARPAGVLSLEALIGAIEQAGDTEALIANAIVALDNRQSELSEGIAELLVRLERFHVIAGSVLAMKAATLTSSCLRCGAEFATEPGPQLCGPCWVALGRPERYLASIQPPTITPGGSPA